MGSKAVNPPTKKRKSRSKTNESETEAEAKATETEGGQVAISTKKVKPRIWYTGIKHMTSNMIRLAGQKDYWDKYPCVLLLPICDLPFAQRWTGEGYDAIMLIDKWDESKTDLQDVAAQVSFLHDGEVENDDASLDRAIDLLRLFCGGILYAVQNRKPNNNAFPYETQGFALPKARQLEDGMRDVRRVRKVKFCGQVESSGHPAPDPILLVCKSAVVWARRHGWKLAAAAEPRDLEDDNSWDTLYAIAAQEFLAKRERAASETLAKKVIGLEVSF